MSFKGSPSHESVSSARMSLITGSDSDSLLPRDFSLVSITSSSAGSASQDEFFKCRDHAETTLRRMHLALDNQQLCDVILIAGIDGKKYVLFVSFLFLTQNSK